MKKLIKAIEYPDFSGGQLLLDLVGKKAFLRMIFSIPQMKCSAMDLHVKQSVFTKYASACDHFRRCYLSIMRYPTPYMEWDLQQLGLKGAFDLMEEVWEENGLL